MGVEGSRRESLPAAKRRGRVFARLLERRGAHPSSAKRKCPSWAPNTPRSTSEPEANDRSPIRCDRLLLVDIVSSRSSLKAALGARSSPRKSACRRGCEFTVPATSGHPSCQEIAAPVTGLQGTADAARRPFAEVKSPKRSIRDLVVPVGIEGLSNVCSSRAPTGASAPLLTFNGRWRVAVMQRLLSVGAGVRTHAEWHQAVVGSCDRRLHERRLCEVLRSQALPDLAGAAPPTASPAPGGAVPTHRSRWRFLSERPVYFGT